MLKIIIIICRPLSQDHENHSQQGRSLSSEKPKPAKYFTESASTKFFQRPGVKSMLHRAVCKQLFGNSSYQTNFCSGIFAKYFPELYDHYNDTMELVCAISPDCFYTVEGLPFTSYTLNVGKQCVCNVHVDGLNMVAGLCMVIPFGTFDHRKEGHLIMHEIKMVFELPSGSIVLFPSAIISHENVGIAPGKERQAFTGYTAAATFQWVQEAFDKVPKRSAKEAKAHGDEMWAKGKSRFPHIYSLY